MVRDLGHRNLYRVRFINVGGCLLKMVLLMMAVVRLFHSETEGFLCAAGDIDEQAHRQSSPQLDF